MQKITEYLGGQLALQKERLFLWSPVALGVGIGLYFALKSEPPLAAGIGAFVAALALAVLSSRRHEETAPRYTAWLCAVFLTLAAAGFLAAQVRTLIVATPMLDHEIQYADIEGTVERIEPLEEGGGSRIILADPVIEKLAPQETPRKVRLRLRKDEGIEPGQRIKALAGLNPPSPPVMPGAFDFRLYSYFSSVGAVGFIYKAPEILSRPAHEGWDLFWEKARLGIARAISAYMPPREAAMASALIVGKRMGISEADNEAMRDAGLAHIISISGLHIGIVSALVFFIARLLMAAIPPFALRHPIKKYAAILAIIAAFLYTVLADAPVPTQRSMLMTSIVFLAIILDRAPITMRLVAVAALVVLLFSPDSLLSASFQMSFAAVAALVGFYEHYAPWAANFYRHAGFLRRAGLYFAGVCVTTLIAGSATAPFALYHFQQYAQYGLIANALAVPLSSFVIMPAGLLGVLLLPFGLSRWPFYAMGKGIDWMYDVAYWTAGLPGARVNLSAWPHAALILMTVAGLVLLLWKGHGKVVLIPLVAIIVLCIFIYKQPDILISSDNALKAYRGEDGALYVSSRGKDKFVLENWERRLGVAEGSAKKWPREGREGAMACDGQGCRLELKGKKIAFVAQAAGLEADCAWADIVIYDQKAEGCAAPLWIDAPQIYKGGAHVLYLDGDAKIRRVNDETGKRPWTN